MKNFSSVVALAFALFIVGFISSSFLTDLSGKMLQKEIISFDLWDEINPKLGLGMLLALCPLSAYALSWAYSKFRSIHFSKLVFIFGFLISIAIAGISIWLHLIQLYIFLNLGNRLPADISLSPGGLNYFGWGFWPLFWIYGIVICVLLWGSRERRKREINRISQS